MTIESSRTFETLIYLLTSVLPSVDTVRYIVPYVFMCIRRAVCIASGTSDAVRAEPFQGRNGLVFRHGIEDTQKAISYFVSSTLFRRRMDEQLDFDTYIIGDPTSVSSLHKALLLYSYLPLFKENDTIYTLLHFSRLGKVDKHAHE